MDLRSKLLKHKIVIVWYENVEETTPQVSTITMTKSYCIMSIIKSSFVVFMMSQVVFCSFASAAIEDNYPRQQEYKSSAVSKQTQTPKTKVQHSTPGHQPQSSPPSIHVVVHVRESLPSHRQEGIPSNAHSIHNKAPMKSINGYANLASGEVTTSAAAFNELEFKKSLLELKLGLGRLHPTDPNYGVIRQRMHKLSKDAMKLGLDLQNLALAEKPSPYSTGTDKMRLELVNAQLQLQELDSATASGGGHEDPAVMNVLKKQRGDLLNRIPQLIRQISVREQLAPLVKTQPTTHVVQPLIATMKPSAPVKGLKVPGQSLPITGDTNGQGLRPVTPAGAFQSPPDVVMIQQPTPIMASKDPRPSHLKNMPINPTVPEDAIKVNAGPKLAGRKMEGKLPKAVSPDMKIKADPANKLNGMVPLKEVAAAGKTPGMAMQGMTPGMNMMGNIPKGKMKEMLPEKVPLGKAVPKMKMKELVPEMMNMPEKVPEMKMKAMSPDMKMSGKLPEMKMKGITLSPDMKKKGGEPKLDMMSKKVPGDAKKKAKMAAGAQSPKLPKVPKLPVMKKMKTVLSAGTFPATQMPVVPYVQGPPLGMLMGPLGPMGPIVPPLIPPKILPAGQLVKPIQAPMPLPEPTEPPMPKMLPLMPMLPLPPMQ